FFFFFFFVFLFCLFFFFFQAEDGIRDGHVTGVQTCALPIFPRPVALGDVVVGLERSRRSPLAVPLQGPAARRDDLGPIPSRVNELTLPAPGANQISRDVFQRCGEDRLVQVVRLLADGLVPLPPIQFLRAPVPVGDHVVHIAHEDRVVRQIEERRLLS